MPERGLPPQTGVEAMWQERAESAEAVVDEVGAAMNKFTDRELAGDGVTEDDMWETFARIQRAITEYVTGEEQPR